MQSTRMKKSCTFKQTFAVFILFFNSQIQLSTQLNRTYSVTYIPKIEGNYKVKNIYVYCLINCKFVTKYLLLKVIIEFSNQDVLNSSFDVYVQFKSEEKTKCIVHGPGIELNGNFVDKQTWFELDLSRNEDVEVSILDPMHQLLSCSFMPISGGRLRYDYCAKITGTHIVNVIKNGNPIPYSPFLVNITQSN